MKYLVTGAAGFVGSYVTKKLLKEGNEVVGLDNLNNYYDIRLKEMRLSSLKDFPSFRFKKINIADQKEMRILFEEEKFDIVIHLAAQAGVRYSLKKPFDYVESNLVGMVSILESCRLTKVKHLVYASSSSVYGKNKKVPFSENDVTDEPASLYAATKKSNELLAFSYSSLYKIPSTGLRFFTVYGPAGRPDMAPWLFTEAILNAQKIKVFNHGEMQRDFTYIDDIVEGVFRVLSMPSKDNIPHRILNIGNNKPIKLEYFIQVIENACGKKAVKEFVDMQPGDVPVTYADTQALEKLVGYKPKVSIEEGMENFVQWFIKNWL